MCVYTNTLRTLIKIELCCLSCRSIAARVGRNPMTINGIWNRWFQDGNTELLAGSQRPPITSNREEEDRRVTRLALMDRAATSQALSQELGSFTRQQCLQEQFDDVYNSMDSQLEDHGCGYS
ncbi:HTH_Tnp_Tc3_2 domain-containing protein [Trichonephila clavipes]|nr:HTH_Tnp_Tc3_2 domain-containing protein [Trichonephila clavipes]